MIQSSDEPIEVDQVRKLHLWLNQPESILMEEIISAKATRLELQALAETRESLAGFPDKSKAAAASHDRAYRYVTFIDVLNELRADPHPVKISITHERRN